MVRYALLLTTALLVSPLLARPAKVTPPQSAATLIGRSTDWKPGYPGDFDHFGFDLKSNRLWLAAEDHGTLWFTPGK